MEQKYLQNFWYFSNKYFHFGSKTFWFWPGIEVQGRKHTWKCCESSLKEGRWYCGPKVAFCIAQQAINEKINDKSESIQGIS